MTFASVNDGYTIETEHERPLYSCNSAERATNDLPHLPDPFLGRDKDVNDIIHLLSNTSEKIVHIWGLPAVGKSKLANRVGHKMARRGFAVQYINADETLVFNSRDESKSSMPRKSYSQKASSALSPKTDRNFALPWYSPCQKRFVSTTAQDLVEWAKGLSNLTLLILDNCDSLLQGRELRNNDFTSVLDALSKAPNLKTVTTSRSKINMLNTKPYKLKQLDNESAIELLRWFSPVNMTMNDSTRINELLDGIPLALQIVGSLVSDIRPPNVIIKELQQNLTETLTPEDVRPDTEKMRPVVRLSFNYLDSDTQKCARYLSRFPRSFTQEAADDILRNLTNSTPFQCQKTLSDASLLDHYKHTRQIRFQYHRIIKEYLIDFESHDNPAIVTSMDASFNSSFVFHYTQTLSDFVNEPPHDEQNLVRFEHESHNFECLLKKVYIFELWTVKSVVELTHAITSDLMLKTFGRSELLKVGQQTLVMFESRMNKISTQIGALETLNIYRDLVVTLRAWIQLESDCKSVCEETFLKQGYETRLQTIDNLLSKANKSARDFYRELHFSFYGESICLSYCWHFESLDHHMVKFTTVLFIILNMVTAAKKMQSYAADLVEEVGPYTDFSPVFFMSIAILLSS